jgi:GABA(A) receptor-associated protein
MFKSKYTFEERKKESSRVLSKYPDRIPIICERNTRSRMEEIDKNKYLVPNDLSAGQFIYVIRKRLRLPAEKAVFIFINGTIPSSHRTLAVLYDEHQDRDGFMYITYCEENVFGNI